MKTVIFDLDGTLADVSHRRRFKDDGSFDWKYFNDPENIKNDTVNDAVVHLCQSLLGQYRLIICTGRFQSSFHETEKWLNKNSIVHYETLEMRPDDNYEEDYILKNKMLDYLTSNGHKIAFTVDDRQQVVDMWRRNGITCLQCAKGDF